MSDIRRHLDGLGLTQPLFEMAIAGLGKHLANSVSVYGAEGFPHVEDNLTKALKDFLEAAQVWVHRQMA